MSNNVYADLGFDDPVGMQAKSGLFIQIRDLMSAARISTAAAAKLVGVPKPRFEEMLRGHFEDESVAEIQALLDTLKSAAIVEQ